MKWNWGTKIALSFVAYVGFMSYLVISSFQQNIDLVTEDYYAAELKYEQRMNEIKNANNLDQEVEVTIQNDEYLVLLPQKNIDKGQVHFYRPNDQRFDKTIQLAKGENSVIIKKADLIPGKFIIKSFWETQGIKYYKEKEILVK